MRIPCDCRFLVPQLFHYSCSSATRRIRRDCRFLLPRNPPSSIPPKSRPSRLA
jgi:hypothetical protein